MTTFTAQVEGFERKVRELQEAIFKEAAQRLFEKAQTPVGKGGNLPVDTGFLRASFQTTLNAPTASVTFNKEGIPTRGGDDYVFTIANATIDDTIYGVWTANYASFVHYGANGRPGRQWVTLAAQNWNTIVNKVASEFSRT